MTTLREAAQQALEALEFMEPYLATEVRARNLAITALRVALAQKQATMTADGLADSIKRGEKWKVIGCIGHDCEECQTRIAKDALGNFQHQRKDA